MRVIIVGGGVAGLEATLALRELAAERVEIQLLTPNRTFIYRPLLVAEPFGMGGRTELDLEPILADVGARHVQDSLASVELGDHAVLTAGGERVGYDALLIALGARPTPAVPGAITFGLESERGRFSDLLSRWGRRGTRRLAFVVPREATWSIAAYELALLAAAERDARRLEGVEIALVTHEAAPLTLFGAAAARLTAARLEEASVALHESAVAVEFRESRLLLRDRESLPLDEVVALPALEGPAVSGLPQRGRGFVHTDVRMQVVGVEDVWAAGDATAFPVKQGGLAAQQADVAAQGIAARAGAHAPARSFEPVLRGALITGGSAAYLRRRLSLQGDEVASVGRTLWWPPVKLAGNYLGPYLARAAGHASAGRLVDLEPEPGRAERRGEHDRAVELLLAAADAEAQLGDFEGALAWLALVEELNLVIPADYVVRRDEWTRQLSPDAPPSAPADRIGARFGSAADAISDLQRRVGWLREIEHRRGGEMQASLSDFDEGLEQLVALSRETGILPRYRRR